MMDIHELAVAAQTRIRPYVRLTPVEPSIDLGRENDGEVFLKLENIQHTGSFKVRGAVNRLMTLDDNARRSGIVTASSGNHGLATAYAMNRLGISGIIYLTEDASPPKVRALEQLGATIRFHGRDCGSTESYARRQAEKSGQFYISPYNDEMVVGGQGTIGLEILERLPQVDCIMVAVGGGGLIAGIAGAVKARDRKIRVIGCLPEQSSVMAESVRAGRIIEAPFGKTLSDGTAGTIEPDSLTFKPCLDLVDDWVLVSEKEIRFALRRVFEQHRLVIEGAAAVTVAGFLKMAQSLRAQRVAVVICGGNIDVTLFKTLVCRPE